MLFVSRISAKSLFVTLLFLQACSPGFDSNIKINPIIFESSDNNLNDDATADDADANPNGPKVRIGEIRDSRKESAVVEINDRKIYAKDNLSSIIEEALRKRLKHEDFQHSLLSECKISGEISKWHAEVTPAFPTSEITAYAEIKLAVSNNSRTFYNGTYSGENGLKHPNLSEAKTSEILSEAMSQAIVEAFKDKGFEIALTNCQ